MIELHTERGGELTVLYSGPQSRMPARHKGWLQVFEHPRQQHRRYHELEGWRDVNCVAHTMLVGIGPR